MPDQQLNQIIGHLFRREAGKMAAVLTRMLGFQSLDLAEDIVQDTLLKALSVWKIKGIPENPSAWLYKVAKRKAIDCIRQYQVHEQHHRTLAPSLKSEWTLSPTVNRLFFEDEIEDSQLRMIFACCHPTIPYESQIALTLKTLCGLSIQEISNSFLTNDETITKRLFRAREKIREENISLEAPLPATLPGRLDAVLHTLYLLFNEGYNSSHADHLIRTDLCEEAMRLCLLLTRNVRTNVPRTKALLALMCFQASRDDARVGSDGRIRLLQHQDRSTWNNALIERGNSYLNQSAEGDEMSPYHIEAAIAATHAAAISFEKTDWQRILDLYSILYEMKPSPVVALNMAIALGHCRSAAEGLQALNRIAGLSEHYLFHAAIGEFSLELGYISEARDSFEQAIRRTQSKAEKDLLKARVKDLEIKSA